MSPRHEKITSYKRADDGEMVIETKSYYESLSHILEEHEKPMVTSFATLKKDVEMALEHITTDNSPRLVLTIEMGTKTRPMRIVKRWVTLKKDLSR